MSCSCGLCPDSRSRCLTCGLDDWCDCPPVDVVHLRTLVDEVRDELARMAARATS